MLTFNHFNFNVSDLDKSLQFYKDALGLEPVRRKEAEDGSFVLVYLGDGKTDFQLELTWLRDHPQKYTWASASSTWPCGLMITKQPTISTPIWAASVLKIPRWVSILSWTRTATGSRSSPPDKITKIKMVGAVFETAPTIFKDSITRPTWRNSPRRSQPGGSFPRCRPLSASARRSGAYRCSCNPWRDRERRRHG